MSPESLILIAIMAVTQVFLMRQIQKLIDKVMSRNYADYSLSAQFQKPSTAKQNGENVDHGPDELGIMQDFNP